MGWGEFLFGFHGRINRARFWLYVAIALPFQTLLFLAYWVYALSIPGAYENGGPTPLPGDTLGIALASVWFMAMAATLIAGLFVAEKRLHDRNKSWWWVLILLVAPNLLMGVREYLLAANAQRDDGASFLFLFVASALNIWAFVELGCLRGTRGDNRFGPDPLG